MEVLLSSSLPEYEYIRVCLEKILHSNYGLNEKLLINDLQILFNYQNFESLKCENPLKNLNEYLVKLEQEEKKFFLNDLIKFIAGLALKERLIWKDKRGLKYLVANKWDQVYFTKEEISILLANMFLLSTPRRQEHGGQTTLPNCCSKISYEFVHNISAGQAMKSKLRCIHNYFKRIYEKRNDQEYLQLKVYFQRLQFSEEMLKEDLGTVLGNIEISNDKKIENFSDQVSIHADFANEYIGGGSLYDGNVQEEILFNVCPELLVSMIFCQKMEEKESILIIGAERFSSYKGYGISFEITGEYFYKPNIDKGHNRYNTYIACMDATFYQSYQEAVSQYKSEQVRRELIKSLSAFQGSLESDKNCPNQMPVVTGNWGCGMFNGDPQVKLLIQWIACSLHNRKMIYCTLNDQRLKNETNFILSLQGKQVKSILQKIQDFSEAENNLSLFEYLRTQKIE